MSLDYQHNFFEETAKQNPKKICVSYEGKNFDYSFLEKFANKIGNFLISKEIEPNDRICIFTEKNINQYASVLGTLKSGACWVPLSTSFPKARISYLLKVLSPKFIITEKKFLDEYFKIFRKFKSQILILDSRYKNVKKVFSKSSLTKFSSNRPILKYNLSQDDLAYIIFTSGSTGNPKGVMVTHKNTSTFLNISKKLFNFNKGLRFSHFSDLTFDPSIFDLFVCWMNAGTLIPFNKRSYRINPYIYFKDNKKIDVVFCIPSLINNLRENSNLNKKEIKSIKHLILTGEAIPKNLIYDWYKSAKKSKVYNVYGTTETAIISHCFEVPKNIKKNQLISVGKPLPLMRIFLKNNGQISPNIKKGEHYVYGPQISEGYWASPYLNKKYFINNPIDERLPQKVYKTGDILKIDSQGNYFYLGRSDSQEKVQGYRIELEEIELVISEIETVDQTKVTVEFDKKMKSKYLAAFITTKDTSLNSTKIIKIISGKLPRYMIPQKVIILKKDFPRNKNGKIDKQKLKNLI